LIKGRSGRLLGYLWLCALGGALLFSAQHAYQRSLRVDEYALGCDPFGYLRMARQIRRAVSTLELPQFHLESIQTRRLIDLMRSRDVPLPLWDEIVAPHAHHYFPRAGSVGVQYPPGAGLMLALFPEGHAVAGLTRATVVLFVTTGILLLALAGARQAWLSAGFVTLALHLGLGMLGKVGTDSFSINAVLAPLLLGFLCVFTALAIRARSGRSGAAWVAAVLGGCLLGLAMLIRLPIIFLIPGLLVVLWPASWRLLIRDLPIPFGLGMMVTGILPLLAHQYRMTGAWYLATYGRDDSAPPSLEPMRSNLPYYLGGGPGSKHNWALLAVAVGLGGLLAYYRRHKLTSLDLSWTRLLASALILWGLPTVYFLTHRITISYYAIPATFGRVLLLALGALTIEGYGSPVVSRTRSTTGVWRYWAALALVLALLPGVVTLKRARSAYIRPVVPFERPARHFVLPAELSEERSWVWADILTGTLWYYANKPAFKVGFTDT
jgi:4-amino-4-deoxy-L-arabinose transferase-like glycosyltransferase